MPAFWIGIAMIAYDMSGHAVCAIARTTQTGNVLWNSYSRYVWPSIPDSLLYDIYWASWFAIAIVLILVGHFTPAKWHPDILFNVTN